MVTMVYLLVSVSWEAFHPKMVASQIQSADRGARRVPLCWWHGKGCSNRREDAKRWRSSIWLLWQLWPHNQHKKDRGGLSTSTWQALQGAYHYRKGQRLQMVDKFTYLGSTSSRVVHIDDEVNVRIAKTSAAFGWPRRSVWDRRGIRLDTKLKVYKAAVLSTLLYGCETWTG